MITSGMAIASRAVSSSSAHESARRSRDSSRCTVDNIATRSGSSRQRAGSKRRARAMIRPGASKSSGVGRIPGTLARRSTTPSFSIHIRVNDGGQPRGHIEWVWTDLEVVASESLWLKPARSVGRRWQRGNRPGLQNGELPVRPGPLDVLRLREVPGDRRAHARQLQQIDVWQHRSRGFRTSHLLDTAAGTRPDLYFLSPQAPFHDLPAVACVPENEVVGRYETADEGLAETGAGLDDRLVARAGNRICGEHHTGHVRGNHSLHDNGKLHRRQRESMLLAVIHRTLAPERTPAAADCIEQCLFAAHAEECLLLTGKRRMRQVLGCRARADSNGPTADTAVGLQDRSLHFCGNRRLFEPGPSLGRIASAQGIDEVKIEMVALHDKVVSGRGDHETGRYWEPCAQ